MALKHWKQISREIKFTNKWWKYIVDKYRLEDGEEGEYHFCHTEGSSFVIPMMDDGRILMVNQYRYLNDRESIEFPGGGVKEMESYEQAAHRELVEETGFDGELQKAGYFNPYSGVTNEMCHVYVARNLKPSKEFSKDEHEDFEILYLNKDEIEKKIHSNEIFSGMTLASWLLAKKLI
jgi:ADP-ribose pyrophosphatase